MALPTREQLPLVNTAISQLTAKFLERQRSAWQTTNGQAQPCEEALCAWGVVSLAVGRTNPARIRRAQLVRHCHAKHHSTRRQAHGRKQAGSVLGIQIQMVAIRRRGACLAQASITKTRPRPHVQHMAETRPVECDMTHFRRKQSESVSHGAYSWMNQTSTHPAKSAGSARISRSLGKSDKRQPRRRSSFALDGSIPHAPG